MSTSKSGPLSVQSVWERVQGATTQRATTAQVWDAIRAAAAEEGRPIPPDAFQTVNRLRSMSVGLRNATEAFRSAEGNQVIVDRMIGTTPYARDLNAQNAMPRWQVSFQQLTQTETGVSLVWRSDIFTGALPTTKADLINELNATGLLLAEQYNVRHVGIGDVQIAAL